MQRRHPELLAVAWLLTGLLLLVGLTGVFVATRTVSDGDPATDARPAVITCSGTHDGASGPSRNIPPEIGDR
jgi:hypothetical protein